jgi:kanamycin kinase
VSRPVIAEIPTGPVAVPAVIAALAGGDLVVPVWRNELGGLTFRLDDGRGRIRYAKWVAAETPEIDLPGEAERLSWARRWASVPRVVEGGSDSEGAWLVTAGVPGRSAVDPRWIADPAVAATAIGRGLRLLHDALPWTDARSSGASSAGSPAPTSASPTARARPIGSPSTVT